jgi:hypothetical protein
MAKGSAELKDLRFCFDRIIIGDKKIDAMHRAIHENKENEPVIHKLPGMSVHPMKMALIAGKKWLPGRTLKICFLDGSPTQQQRTIDHAVGWLKYANIQFDFKAACAESDVRISFGADAGSWSFIGTDNLHIDKSEVTMNFGWLQDDTDDQEYNRVVLHEFGHALGCIHEHQNPEGAFSGMKRLFMISSADPPTIGPVRRPTRTSS